MESITKYLPLLKDQIDHNQRQAEKFGIGNPRSSSYLKRANEFTELCEAIENLPLDTNESTPPSSDKRLSLIPKDLEGLPQELIDQLSTKVDSVESDILKILEESGGVASLDQILIGLYRLTQEVHQRNKLNSKIYRMIQKGLVDGVEGKKAVYKVIEE